MAMREEKVKPLLDKIKTLLEESVDAVPDVSTRKSDLLQPRPVDSHRSLPARSEADARQQHRRERHPPLRCGQKELALQGLAARGQGQRNPLLTHQDCQGQLP